MKKNNKDPINLYWAPLIFPSDPEDWSFMYEKPKTLYSELLAYRQPSEKQTSEKQPSENRRNKTVFACPAFSDKFTKSLVIKNPFSCSYEYSYNPEYDYTDEKQILKATTPVYVNAEYTRSQGLTFGPSIVFSLRHMFFADSPLKMTLCSPFFHEPKHTKYGAIYPGSFDVGQWFRPINIELQMWKQSGELILEKDEPMYYLLFDTDRPIILHRFVLDEQLIKYAYASVGMGKLFSQNFSLLERYKKFKDVGHGEKILTRIKQNLVEEKPYKF
jgi:hypothetical protein